MPGTEVTEPHGWGPDAAVGVVDEDVDVDGDGGAVVLEVLVEVVVLDAEEVLDELEADVGGVLGDREAADVEEVELRGEVRCVVGSSPASVFSPAQPTSASVRMLTASAGRMRGAGVPMVISPHRSRERGRHHATARGGRVAPSQE